MTLLALLLAAVPSFAADFETQAAQAAAPLVAQGRAHGELVRWWAFGGLTPYNRYNVVTRGGEFRHERFPNTRYGTQRSCLVPAPRAHAAVLKALADKDVAAAVATGGLFGLDESCHDGGLLGVEVAGKILRIGSDCPAPGAAMSCQTSCAPVRPGLRALETLLESIAKDMKSEPSCADAMGFDP